MWLFDTTFIIDLFRHDKRALKKAEELDESTSSKAISVVTAHEILRGLFYIGSSHKIAAGEKALAKFDIIPYTYQISRKAAEIDAALMKRGEVISFPDVVIAATALTFGMKLVTRDEHFKRINRLEIESY
jgi:predicted nucleic acid-binding protein